MLNIGGAGMVTWLEKAQKLCTPPLLPYPVHLFYLAVTELHPL